METVWQDLRYAIRLLTKSPGFTVVAILTLGLGIGANTAIFSVMNVVVLRPLPFPEPDRIVHVWRIDPRRGVTSGTASAAQYLDWQDRSHSFEQLAAWLGGLFNLTGEGRPEEVWGARTSANFFDLFKVRPVIGRSFLPADEHLGHEDVAIVSYRLWQRRFGGASNALGQNITIDDQPYTIIGVLPADFSLWGNAGWQYDVWMPFAFDGARASVGPHLFVVFGRLKPAITVAQAEAEMKAIVHQLQAEYPTVDPSMSVRVIQMREQRIYTLRPALQLSLAAAAFVLLIACVNVANLLLSRATAREKEIALRASLGAGRVRLIRQLFTESAFLALLGGILGLLLAAGSLRLLPRFLPPSGSLYEIPYMQSLRIDGRVLGFALLVSLATGILFGLAPAFQMSQTKLSESLKEGGRGALGGRRGHRLGDLLVVSEVTLSLLLLVGAGLLVRSFLKVMSQNLGYKSGNLLTLQIRLPAYRYSNGSQFNAFFKQVAARVEALPGVRSAGMINLLPLTGWTSHFNFDIEGRPAQPRGDEFTAETRVIDPNYLRTMGIPLLEGRAFGPPEDEQAPGVALINEALRRRYWPNQDPIGKHIRFLPEAKSPFEPQLRESWLAIMGVVGDTTQAAFGEQKPGILYLPYLQNPSPIMRLVLRTYADPAASAAAARHAVELIDKDQPVTEVKAMDEFVDALASRQRLNMALVVLFAAVATALAAIGIYGVMSYTVAQQTHDIGVRMALGAQPQDVLRLVVRQGMQLALAGIALGLLIGLFIVRRILASLLYGVTGADPATLAGAVALLATVALAACYIPARRATRVDPTVALRHE